MYVLVRTDLPLAQQIVQAAHAAHEAGIHFGDKLVHPSSLVLIGVGSEAELRAEYDRLIAAGIPLTLFIEPDMGDAATALASGPLTGGDRRLFKGHKLWSERTS